MSSERPILFSAPMIRAILAGTKTQTRRIVKSAIPIAAIGSGADWDRHKAHPAMQNPRLVLLAEDGYPFSLRCPYGLPGGKLWVRETWGYDWYDDGQTRAWKRFVYRADPGAQPLDNGDPAPWKPSIHMPRAASRITLEITGVRVERLQDISETDAIAEGIENSQALDPCGPCRWRHYGRPHTGTSCPIESYRTLWESINGAGSWDANLWVWCVEFRRLTA